MSDIREYYEAGHRGYQAHKDAIEDSRLANLVDYVRDSVPPGSRILDVGCGDMLLSRLLPEYSWVGIDLDISKDPRIVKQDLTQTPYAFERDSFDAVVCSEVLEHLFDPVSVLSEIRRLTKKWFFATVPNLQSLEILVTGPAIMKFDPSNSISVEHIRWYTPESFVRLLKSTGFEVLSYCGNSPQISRQLQPGRAYLRGAHPNVPQVKLDQLIGHILPDFCPGMLFACKASPRAQDRR